MHVVHIVLWSIDLFYQSVPVGLEKNSSTHAAVQSAKK
jgi:hypothetical protein